MTLHLQISHKIKMLLCLDKLQQQLMGFFHLPYVETLCVPVRVHVGSCCNNMLCTLCVLQ